MPSHAEAIENAALLMRSFAGRTGLTSDRPKQRYLWTDAFAVRNFLGLARLTGERSYADLALRLVDQVHHVLGRYRADDTRTGWISGLGEREGEFHPTRGGLRIGKTLPERRPEEPLDQRPEWDRDGQYFHYLTKWMHALGGLLADAHRVAQLMALGMLDDGMLLVAGSRASAGAHSVGASRHQRSDAGDQSGP